ncbi:MAG: NRDE family protein, partial [Planctomycetes bacterium]|nr:NRDE family protein [Planctomycetota bacterium]
MCTVTIITLPDATVRLACNRDESPLRPAALPPQLRRFGSRFALLPIDPLFDGTWIAANDAGLMMTLLNRYPGQHRQPRDASAPSRGTIIPTLLSCDDLATARRLAHEIARQPFNAFGLILTDGIALTEITRTADGVQIVDTPRLQTPLLFTSSGLGDEIVGAPRRELFVQWFANEATIDRQDQFHRHSWPERPQVSVCMRRPEARTVSCTAIEVGPKSARMTYWPQPPDEAGLPISGEITQRRKGAE